MGLTWKDGRYSSSYGSAGNLTLFSVNYSTTRHADKKMHVVNTMLPMRIDYEKERFASREEAQERCEELLDKFLTHVAKHTGRSSDS